MASPDPCDSRTKLFFACLNSALNFVPPAVLDLIEVPSVCTTRKLLFLPCFVSSKNSAFQSLPCVVVERITLPLGPAIFSKEACPCESSALYRLPSVDLDWSASPSELPNLTLVDL